MSIKSPRLLKVFLISYALLVDMVWKVMGSGVFDFVMGLVLVWFNQGLEDKRQV